MQVHRADIASVIPDGMLAELSTTFEETSRVLGMFEAYDTLLKQDGKLEEFLESDGITIAVLEDLYERASQVVQNADQIANKSHARGFVNLLMDANNQKIPQLSDLRERANSVIAQGWDIEEKAPILGFDPDSEVSDPFAFDIPDQNHSLEMDF